MRNLDSRRRRLERRLKRRGVLGWFALEVTYLGLALLTGGVTLYLRVELDRRAGALL
jgi:hypothetical protein